MHELLADPSPDPADEPIDRSKDARERMSFLRSELEREPITKGAPESLAALRAEFRRIHVESADPTDLRGPRPEAPWGGLLKPSRILLLVVALLAGGVAAYLAVGRNAPAPTPTASPVEEAVAPPPAAMVKVLVATRAIGMGERLSSASMSWQDWPETALRGEYVTNTATPEALTDLSGAMARFEMFPGEPILRDKLADADQGYLSAVLDPGMRAVAVAVAPEAASGGFVLPNDRVDVVLTRATDLGQTSQTIVHNARVLAIDARLGERGTTGDPIDTADPRAQIFKDEAVATLELDPAQAEVLVNAKSSGSLSLVLRAMSDAGAPSSAQQSAANQAIRMSSPFWTSRNAP